MAELIWLLPILVLVILFYSIKFVVVFEYQTALLYRSGKYARTLGPGRHLCMRGDMPRFVDMRMVTVVIPGQEVLSADNVSLKLSIAVNYKVEDPYKAFNIVESYANSLYNLIQLEARNLVGSMPVDDLLANRTQINSALFEASANKAKELGLQVVSVGVKDIMFPGELKTIFAEALRVRKQGLAALEKARGESAALRSLANTAKVLDGNPSLLQLRILQALGENSGNTVVLNTTDQGVQVGAAPKKARRKK